MFLSRTSINRPVLASMMSLALVLFGLISLTRLPVRELPDIDPPIVNVTTIYPGANAAVVETEVTERLEEVINSVEGIRTMTSQSREEMSSITVEFDLSRDIEQAAQDIRDRVSRVRGRLPDTIREPVVAKQDSDARPIIWIGVNSERFTPQELTTLAEQQMKNRLETIQGVSSIRIGGEKRFAMRLWLDAERMGAHRVTILDIQEALRHQNVELPSGRIENLEREMTIQTFGELKTAEEFNRMVIRSDGERLVRLRDVGEAREGVENERTIARNNGRPCIFLGIIKQSKANTVQVARDVRAEIERIAPALPDGIELVFNYDESIYIERAIKEVWLTLGFAFTFVVLVIFLFLRDIRSTIVPAVAIPISILATFFILHLLGFSINILTMLALVLAVGLVVDDAIVVLENVYRHVEEGMPPMEAAFKAMDEIAFAVVATTVALVAVFLPLAFQTSAIGRLFVEFAVAVCGAVIVSTFVALSLSPMMASRILKPVNHSGHSWLYRLFDRILGGMAAAYAAVLQWALRHRWLMGGALAGCAALAVVAYRGLDKEFLPEEDQGRLLIFVAAPEGATVEYTDRMVGELERILEEAPEVGSYGTIVAFGFAGPGLANSAIAFVRLEEERERTVQEMVNAPGGLREQFNRRIPGALIIPQIPKAIGRGFDAPFQVVLQHHDLDALDSYASALSNQLRQEGYLQNVRSSFEFNKPELRLHIDRERAASLGVSIEAVSRTLQILFGSLDISRIRQEGKEYDVIAQLERFSRMRPQDVDRLYIRNAAGDLIQLSSVVTREESVAPNRIEHFNRMRSATITGTPVGMPMGTVIERVEAILEAELPAGFRYTWSGESRDLKDAGRELWWVMLLAIVIVYMVLAAQFESLIHPWTVMLAVPLAGFGALALLWILGNAGGKAFFPEIPGMNINLFSQIGLVLLIGLATKNSILLVEFANQMRAQGFAPREAMVRAAAVRFRPILMTAFSTISGLLPIAIGFGAGAESRRPMGIAVVGGVFGSTLLTLVIIPVIYTVFSELGLRLRPKRDTVEPEALTENTATAIVADGEGQRGGL